MSTTKSQILGTQQEPTQNSAPAVVSPTPPQTHSNGGTVATGNDGNEAPVNDGKAVAGGSSKGQSQTAQQGTVATAGQPAVQETTSTPVTATTVTTPAESVPADATGTTGTEGTAPAVAKPVVETATAQVVKPVTLNEKPVEVNSFNSITEYLKNAVPFKPKTAEEIEKEKKKNKRERMFAAIGDGISALSSLYYASKGGLNTYDPNQSMSKKVRERQEKLQKEYDENLRWYLPTYMQAMKMDEETRRDDRNWRHQLEREAVQDENTKWQQKFESDKFAFTKDSWQEEFDQKVDQFTKTFEENQYQFDKNYELNEKKLNEDIRHNKAEEGLQAQSIAEQKRRNKASEGLQAMQIQAQHVGDNLVFNMGDAGEISIHKNRLNDNNIAIVFNATPTTGRPQASVDPMTGKRVPLSTNDMLQWIGMNANDPKVQKAWVSIGGKSTKGKGY